MSTDSHQNGGVRSYVGEKASGVYSLAQRSLDQVVPPSSRHRLYDASSDFASTRPILFSFIVAQLLLCFLPLLTFGTFAISTVAFALGAAIIFALFWIGVAMLFLLPTLLVASCIATLVWVWAIGSFLVARWLYVRFPVGVQSDVQVTMGSKTLNVVKDENGIDASVDHGN